jgi:hypothetical protein
MMDLRALALVAALAAGCSHTETVKRPPDSENSASAGTATAPKKGAVSRENVREGGAPVPITPEGNLAPGQLKKVQDRLVQRGFLQDRSGALDDATRAAIKKLQKSQDLPETGLPDQETVKRLGLDPDQVFARKGGAGG